jgi:inner membrane protein YidH
MDPLTAPKAGADARDYLAEERTFLAWIRTGVAVMAFGFVVARLVFSWKRSESLVASR